MPSAFCKASFSPLVIQHDIFLNIIHFPLPISFDSALLRVVVHNTYPGEGELVEGENALVELGDCYLIYFRLLSYLK
jgi:hypothetical protein